MTTPRLIITPRRPALIAGHDNEVDVLVRVQAPEAPAELPQRNPLHLSLVIDRSGSMSGQPLAEAKRCAEFVLDGLQATDRLSVVAYDDVPQTLIPATTLDDKEGVRRAIRQIAEGGRTSLHGGWLKGAETLAPHTSESITSRVILLSDGCANVGITEPAQICAQCADLARVGVTTSTYGLGRGFNEELMIGMARQGGGSSYYGQTAEDLIDPFREEFELLNALCARRVRLEIVTAAGVTVRMLNDYTPADSDVETAKAWSLPDLAYGSEAWALMRLRVPEMLVANASTTVQLLTVSIRYTSLDGEPRAIQPQSLGLDVVPLIAFNAIAEDELVARRAGELEAARLQSKARVAAMAGDWHGVEAALQSAGRAARDNPWVAASLDALRELAATKDNAMFVKESAFQSFRLSTRLAEQVESRNVKASMPGASYLRRKTRQGKDETKPQS